MMNKKQLMKYVYAFVMGDGGIYYSNKTSKNPILVANTIIDNEDYVHWRASILENLTNVEVYTVDQTHRNRRNILRTVTKTHPTYTKIHNRLYSTGRKAIDPHQLTFLDAEFLAILYMDDGSCYVDNRCNATPQVSIATKSFSYSENMGLKLAIKEKLGLEFNVHKQTNRGRVYWYLRLPTRYYERFQYLVAPYIFPSFAYKLPERRTAEPSYGYPTVSRGDDIV